MTGKPEMISLWQLFTLVLTFEAGSAIVVGIGNEAQQGAWIAVLIATFIGLVLMLAFHLLIQKHNSLDLYGILEQALGRVAGKAVVMLYVLYFFYLASRVLRDSNELIKTAILINTPMEVLALTLMLLIAYILNLGIEVLARTAEIFAPYLFGMLILILLLAMLSGEYDMHNLQPLLGDGPQTLFHAVFPTLLGFPFGELIVFMLVFPGVTRLKKSRRVSLYAVAVAGLMLTLISLSEVAVLGVDAKERSNFPMLSVARIVSVGEFVERIDALVVFVTLLGIVIKIALFFFAGTKGLEKVFGGTYRDYLLPCAMMISVFSVLVARNFTEHILEGLKFVPMFMHLPLQYGIPLLLLVLLLFKRKRSRKEGGSEHEAFQLVPAED